MLAHARIRRLAAKARYPNLLPELHVHLGRGPAYPDWPYTDYDQNRIYWFGPDVPYDFFHEAGHLYDAQRLTGQDRAEIQRLLKVPGRPWFWDRSPAVFTDRPDPACEVFADAYSVMQLHPHRQRRLRRYLKGKNR